MDWCWDKVGVVDRWDFLGGVFYFFLLCSNILNHFIEQRVKGGRIDVGQTSGWVGKYCGDGARLGYPRRAYWQGVGMDWWGLILHVDVAGLCIEFAFNAECTSCTN